MGLKTEKASQILSLIDLTSLKGDETNADIHRLCDSAHTDYGEVAAVCVYPQFVKQAKSALANASGKNVKVATVVNFPGGEESIQEVADKTRWSIEQGADEIDIVLPYKRLIAGDTRYCEAMLTTCRKACGDRARLKVIIESGELAQPELIKQATKLAIRSGADFVKTSTGKVPVNATLEAAEVILTTIRQSGKQNVGFKASGGIRQPEDAARYLDLAEQIMGENWLKAEHFRFGVSALLDNLLATMEGEKSAASSEY